VAAPVTPPSPGEQATRAAGDRYAEVASYRLAPGSPPGTGAEAATPVLMLHGLGGDSGQLWPYGGGDRARSRLAPDLRAHGATMLVGDPGSFSFGGLTRDLTGLLDRLRFPPAVVIGMSMGAGIAVGLALSQPGRVRGLVLIRPAWLDVVPPPNLLPLLTAGRLLQRHGAAAGLDRFVESAQYRDVLDRSPAAAASLVAQFRAPHAVQRAVRLTRLPQSRPFARTGDLGRISAPSVVVGTRGDPQHPVEMARIWQAALPGSHLAQAPPRDADPAGYVACLAEVTGEFVAGLDRERRS
jgi:pimeloyl-ACP methyl ester carboxylesterase